MTHEISAVLPRLSLGSCNVLGCFRLTGIQVWMEMDGATVRSGQIITLDIRSTGLILDVGHSRSVQISRTDVGRCINRQSNTTCFKPVTAPWCRMAHQSPIPDETRTPWLTRSWITVKYSQNFRPLIVPSFPLAPARKSASSSALDHPWRDGKSSSQGHGKLPDAEWCLMFVNWSC